MIWNCRLYVLGRQLNFSGFADAFLAVPDLLLSMPDIYCYDCSKLALLPALGEMNVLCYSDLSG